MKSNYVKNSLMGLILGDALGVPYEFNSRETMRLNPAKEMIGYGTYFQEPGTWSDDGSLTLCLADSLLNGYNLNDIAQKFVQWRFQAYWSARGEVFDIGMTTAKSIDRLKQFLEKNDFESIKNQKLIQIEDENGNGSLMRILPLLLIIKEQPIDLQFETICEVSSLTHRHIRSSMACLIYLRYAEKLLHDKDKIVAYEELRYEIQDFWNQMNFPLKERKIFSPLILQDIREVSENNLDSNGYVMSSLNASFWYFLTKESYNDIVFSIINLGNDTDTNAAIAGGLAGLYYGLDNIPEHWFNQIARIQDIEDLCAQLQTKYL